MQVSGSPDDAALRAPMSILSVGIGKQHRKHGKQKVRGRPVGIGHNMGPAFAPPLTPLNDDQVLTFAEWVRLNRISPRNGRRILQSGDGPRVVQLSTRRIGVTVGANRLWQQSRTRGGA
jgi:hypothetical protein